MILVGILAKGAEEENNKDKGFGFCLQVLECWLKIWFVQNYLRGLFAYCFGGVALYFCKLGFGYLNYRVLWVLGVVG